MTEIKIGYIGSLYKVLENLEDKRKRIDSDSLAKLGIVLKVNTPSLRREMFKNKLKRLINQMKEKEDSYFEQFDKRKEYSTKDLFVEPEEVAKATPRAKNKKPVLLLNTIEKKVETVGKIELRESSYRHKIEDLMPAYMRYELYAMSRVNKINKIKEKLK